MPSLDDAFKSDVFHPTAVHVGCCTAYACGIGAGTVITQMRFQQCLLMEGQAVQVDSDVKWQPGAAQFFCC